MKSSGVLDNDDLIGMQGSLWSSTHPEMRTTRLAAFSVAVCWAIVTFAPASAHGQSMDFGDEEHRLTWNEDWPRVSTWEFVAVGALAATALTLQLAIVPEAERWKGGVLLDDFAHDNFALSTRDARQTAGYISDILKWTLFLYPFVIDTALVTGVADENFDVAWQMFWINSLAAVSTVSLLALSKNLVRRGRPFLGHCTREPDFDWSCEEPDRFRSFFSGHSAFAFMGAGLICAHHLHFPLYGGGIHDNLACWGAIGGAVTTAILRVLADKHWLSDVLVGALVGTLAGYVLPSLLHYGFKEEREEGTAP